MLGFGLVDASAQIQCPGITVVGCGYDIFGEYANNKSAKEQLFRLENYQAKPMDDGQEYKIPDIVRLKYINEKDYKIIEGSSLREYSKSLNASVGVEVDAVLFSGGIESSFGSSSTSNTSNHFITLTDWTRIWEVAVNPTKTNLRDFLTPEAKNAIDTWNTKKLFEVFGTHYVSSGYFGGAMDFSLSEEASSTEEANSISVSVKAKYKMVSANSSVEVQENEKNENMMSNTKIYSRGGDVQYANKSASGDNDQYNLWVNSIPTKSVLIDFKKGSLVGIWTLAATDARKNEIKAAFDKLAKNYPMPAGNAASTVQSNVTNFICSASDEGYWDFNGFHFDAASKGGILQTAEKDINDDGYQGADRFFALIPHPTKTGLYFIQPQHCPYVIGISNNSKTAGAKVELVEKSNTNTAQLFELIESDDDETMFFLKNSNSGLFLTSNGMGKAITQEASLGTKTPTSTNKGVGKATKGVGKMQPKNSGKTIGRPSSSTGANSVDRQKWNITGALATEMAPPLVGKYRIKHYSGGLYFDIPGDGKSAAGDNTQVQIFTIDDGTDRTIMLKLVPNQTNRFFMQPLDGNKVLELQGRSTSEGGHLVEHKQHGATSQQFIFEAAGIANTFYIKNVNSNLYLQIDESVINSNRSLIIQKKSKTDAAKWVLEKIEDYHMPDPNQNFYLKCAFTSKYLDKSDSKGYVQIWQMDSGKDRLIKFVPTNDRSFVVMQVQEKNDCVTIPDNNQANTARLGLEGANNNDSQKFAISPISPDKCVILTTSGKCIDVTGAKTNENGSRLGLHDNNYQHNQKFQLIYADGPKKNQVYRFF